MSVTVHGDVLNVLYLLYLLYVGDPNAQPAAASNITGAPGRGVSPAGARRVPGSA